MASPMILVRVPFRISLGGGSTDLPSYYRKYGGFVFAVSINLYMDVLIKRPRSDDFIHVHYREFEAVKSVAEVRHDLAKEALRMTGVDQSVSVSFKADTPAGTGLGSSGACSVALLKGLYLYRTGRDLPNLKAAAQAFKLTQNLGLPDGMQDPYACALGGFQAFEIAKSGRVTIRRPKISRATARSFFDNSLFFYTGIQRESSPILTAQDAAKVLQLKHQTKTLGQGILEVFERGDLDGFGCLMDEHWQIKKQTAQQVSNPMFDDIYAAAKQAGALGGKIMGAGGGGYFMFYCPTAKAKAQVRAELRRTNMREMFFDVDKKGARAMVVEL